VSVVTIVVVGVVTTVAMGVVIRSLLGRSSVKTMVFSWQVKVNWLVE